MTPTPGPPINQPTLRPTAKIAAVGASGTAATILIVIAQRAHLELPPEVAAAIVTLVTFGAGWWKKERAKRHPAVPPPVPTG